MAQDPVKVEPQQYKVVEVDTTGSVSPDGRFLSYVDWSTGDLAIHDLKTGEGRHLTNKGFWLDSSEFAVFSTISPCGTQVAYAWFNKDGFWELRVIGVDGSGPRVLYRNRELRWLGPKEWSPDGKQILATIWRKDRSAQMALVSLDDGALRVLKTFGWPHSGTMSFSPDGRYIAYDYPPQEDSRGPDIFLLSIDGSREIALVQHPARDVLLGWAPDGKRILFASDRMGTVDAWAIQVAAGKLQGDPELVKTDIGPNVVALGFTRKGSYYYGVESWVNDVYVATLDPATDEFQNSRKLVSHVAPDTSADWSPDGQYLVYVSPQGPPPPGSAVYSWVLLIRSVETGKERQLPLRIRRFHAFQPRWSPDGHSLLAQGRNYKGRAGLYRIDAQTGEVTPIVQTRTACPPDCIEWPTGSPDGKFFFTRWTTKGPERTIVVRNLETGGEKELQRVASPIGVGVLTVSPDSQWLAFLREDLEKGTMALKVMPTAGGESRELARVRPPQRIAALAWMPDSRHIVYATRTTGEERKFELWQIATEGGQPQHLGLVMQGIRPYGLSIHPDGRRIAFTAGRPPREEVWVLENFLPALQTAGVQHVTVASEPGRFKAWPANGGLWSWGDEILVMYTDCALDPSVAETDHALDENQPCYLEQVRSLDGGQTWNREKKVIDPSALPGNLKTSMDFSNPNFALFFKQNWTGSNYGRSYFYYSYDRGRTWKGPYELPLFGFEAVFARTDYIIDGSRESMAFLSGGPRYFPGSEVDDEDGHSPFLVRTADGGITWDFVASSNRPAPPLGSSAEILTIQPSSVRVSPTKLLSLARCYIGSARHEQAWIEAWMSNDAGSTWSYLSRIDIGNAPTPPSATLLADGRLVVTYGFRAAPYGVRARISDDQGATWSKEFILRQDGGNWDLGYTRDALRPDGKMITVYYFNKELRAERTIEATIWDPNLAFGPAGDWNP